MRAFTCDNCGQRIFFENDRCLRCRSPLGYVHRIRDVVALTEASPGLLVDQTGPEREWQRCVTYPVTGCNWLVPATVGSAGSFCESCALTRTRPADGDAEGMAELVRGEMAKRRLVFQLAELHLPVTPRDETAGRGLAFDLLSSTATKVVTGHDNGVITLDLAEADNEYRERMRQQLSEPYRTLLGHFRHEIGHYFWPVLINRPNLLDECRTLCGDDRVDYAAAVKSHYDAPTDNEWSWSQTHISRYATMHPYEDWAETFAHYLHILDTLQTADSFGLTATGNPRSEPPSRYEDHEPDARGSGDGFDDVIHHWLELSYGLNQVNRSMGHEDLYPFVLAPKVTEKLAFVDRLVCRR